MIGILAHGDNHFIVCGPLPDEPTGPERRPTSDLAG